MEVDEMSEPAMPLEAQIMSVLSPGANSESDQAITELGYVRTVTVDDKGVTINLQVPPVSTSQSHAYLSTREVHSARREVDGIGAIDVLLDDHDDSDAINAGPVFLRKAHRAALERCVSALVQRDSLAPSAIQRLILRDLPDGRDKTRLLQCRFALGLSMCLNSKVFVDDEGRPLAVDELPLHA
ncbi:metal-sulfur cluster biosynthetic enzyme [[Mycobacterium] crassicus]|uniref:Metal-sulfur cluster biosynthetic enzyme n=1 Tax=[Mycobacterium] crassicus TaxID=2872309 RepID=A0ABU5XM29_9MYCO|nr:metal-sulfur cluster biosynthetic enzyme [Mycolicibacter sp. MYC098]MEB3023331.1 metal-sulfur cluster biosynthetic enzyme [Mycolicibacter sp. MYC098]